MAEMEVKIVEDNTDTIKTLMVDAMRIALEAVGLAAEGYAKRLCPVDTGRLRNSITHTADEEYAYIGTNVEYAPYIEYGTSRMDAQPFLKPAVVNNVDKYARIFEHYAKNA